MNMKKVVTGSLAGIMAVSAMAVNTFADLTTGTTVNQEAKEKTWNLTESGWKIQYPTSFTGKITYTMEDAAEGGSVAANVAAYKAKMVYYIKAFDAKDNGDPNYEKPAVIDGDVKLAVTGKYTNQYGNVSSQTVTATATPVKLANGLYKVTFWMTKHDDNLTGGNTISMNKFSFPKLTTATNGIAESTEFSYGLSYNIVGSKVYTSKNDANKALNNLNVWSQVSGTDSVVNGSDYDSSEKYEGLTWWENNNKQVPSTTYDGTYNGGGSVTPPDANYPNYKNALATLATAKTSFTTAETSYNNAKKSYEDVKSLVANGASLTAAEWHALKNTASGGDITATASATPLNADAISALNKLFPTVIKAKSGDAWNSITMVDGSTATSISVATGINVYSTQVTMLGVFADYDTKADFDWLEDKNTATGSVMIDYRQANYKKSEAYLNTAKAAYADGVTGSWDIPVSALSGNPASLDAVGIAAVSKPNANILTTSAGIDASYLADSSVEALEKLITAANVKATLSNGASVNYALAKQIDQAIKSEGVDTIAGTTVNSGSSLGKQLATIHDSLDKHDDGDLSDHNDVDSVKWVNLQTLTGDEDAKVAILHYLYNTKGATLTFNFAYDDNGDEEGKGADGFSDDSDKLSGSKNALKEMSLRANEVGVMTEAKEMKDWSVSFDWDEIMQNTFGYDVNNTGNIWSLQAKLNMKNESIHDAIYDGNLYLKSVTVKVPEKTFTILAAGEGTSDSTEDVVAPESSDASSESSSEAESSEASSVESSEPAPETPVTNPSTGNAPIALAVIPVAVAAAAVIIKKRG